MKALTLIQPWATLLAIKAKGNETRSWATKYRGPLAIHAGKKIDKEVCNQELFKSVLAAHGYTADNLPTGCVIAVCNLSDCVLVRRENYDNAELADGRIVKDNEYYFGNYTPGRYAWKMEDMKMLDKPVPAKGALSLWEWSGK